MCINHKNDFCEIVCYAKLFRMVYTNKKSLDVDNLSIFFFGKSLHRRWGGVAIVIAPRCLRSLWFLSWAQTWVLWNLQWLHIGFQVELKVLVLIHKTLNCNLVSETGKRFRFEQGPSSEGTKSLGKQAPLSNSGAPVCHIG